MNRVQFTEDDLSSVEKRIYSKRNSATGEMEWFFCSREGDMGPFGSVDVAKGSIPQHIERCRRSNLDGGRRFESKQAEHRVKIPHKRVIAW